jgi:hypothetical protein
MSGRTFSSPWAYSWSPLAHYRLWVALPCDWLGSVIGDCQSVRGGISVIERDALGCRGSCSMESAIQECVVVFDGKSRVMWCVKTRGQNSATFSQPFATKCRRRPEHLTSS